MLAYKIKLYRSHRNKHLVNIIEQFAKVYNYCVGTYDRCYEWYGKSLGGIALKNHISKIKKRPAYSWIKRLDAQAVQDVVERIERARKLCFNNRKRGIKASLPRHKNPEEYKSFTLKQTGYKFLENNRVRLLGRTYRYHKSREIEGKIKTVTIKRDNIGNLWLFVVTDYERSEKQSVTGKIVGFDFGMKQFLVGSDGTTIDSPLFLKSQHEEQKKLNRSLSRKQKGSKHWLKAKWQLAKFHQRVENQRNDHQWKLARWLLLNYDAICLEDLNLKGMSKHFGKKIGDYGFGALKQKLDYLARVFGKLIQYVPRFFASSQICSDCGHQHKGLKLKDREWVCPKCGKHHDRDFNAAINILREGTSSLRLDRVRPKFNNQILLDGGICCLNLESPVL